VFASKSILQNLPFSPIIQRVAKQFASGVNVENYYNLLTDVFERLSKWRQLKNEIHTKLRLLYLECRRNLELLNVIELDNPEGILTDDEDYKSTANALQTEVLEMVFLDGRPNNKLYESLRKNFKYTEISEGEDGAPNKKEQHASVIQAVVYLYVKIDSLKKILGIERKGSAHKKIYIRARLANIKENFIHVVNLLSSHKEVKEILCGER
jgi:hypothetical protein